MMTKAASALVLLLTTAFAVSAAPVFAATLVVDAANPELECPNADFPSINAAVAVAMPGDTIMVCPGQYLETVVVNKTLKLKGATKALKPEQCFEPTAPDPRQDSIVDGIAFSFSLGADDIELTGFVVQRATNGIITGAAFSGYWIHGNIVQDNPGTGISVFSSGTSLSVLQNNCVRTNATLQFFGISVRGQGFTDIDHNSFFRNSQGITVQTTSNVNVLQNVSLEERFFFVAANANDVKVEHNEVRNSVASAIAPAGSNTRFQIEHNQLQEGGNGIDFFALFLAPNSDFDVRHNHIDTMTGSGIQARPNTLVNSRIIFNHSTDNGRDGVRIEAVGNAGNHIENNHLLRNAEHDCHDDTIGPGTAGTANFWSDNKAETDNRGGQLCPPRGKK